jgi:hypothetical protein
VQLVKSRALQSLRTPAAMHYKIVAMPQGAPAVTHAFHRPPASEAAAVRIEGGGEFSQAGLLKVS